MKPLRHIHNAPRPLVVDVDGGLLARDPVRFGLRQILQRRPASTLRTLGTRSERPEFALQTLLSEPGAFLPRIPVRTIALDAIGLWQRFGAPVVLISQLPESMVAHLRDALCPGARLFGARQTRVLDGRGKSDLLEAVFGHGGFDLLAKAGATVPGVMLARRAMLVGLTASGKRRLLSDGVQATALASEYNPRASVCLRAGAGWTVDWAADDVTGPAEVPALRPETHLPSPDFSDAGHSRTDRAARS